MISSNSLLEFYWLSLSYQKLNYIASYTYNIYLIMSIINVIAIVKGNSNYCHILILFTPQPCRYPMDTSSSIHHRFDVEIPRGKFVEITSILKGESTWKLWHRFDVEISTSIRLSKSTKYRCVFHVDFSTLFRRRIDVTSVLAVSIVLFPNISCSGNLL